MENNINNLLDKFNNEENEPQRILIGQKEGLIERIDRQYITKDGRMLLREQY